MWQHGGKMGHSRTYPIKWQCLRCGNTEWKNIRNHLQLNKRDGNIHQKIRVHLPHNCVTIILILMFYSNWIECDVILLSGKTCWLSPIHQKSRTNEMRSSLVGSTGKSSTLSGVGTYLPHPFWCWHLFAPPFLVLALILTGGCLTFLVSLLRSSDHFILCFAMSVSQFFRRLPEAARWFVWGELQRSPSGHLWWFWPLQHFVLLAAFQGERKHAIPGLVGINEGPHVSRRGGQHHVATGKDLKDASP